MSQAHKAALVLFAMALLLRLAGAGLLGGGAPFGPDGTGAEAAVHLGGHLYPLHIEGIRLAGSALGLSLFCGAATCPLLWLFGRRRGLGGAGGWWAAFLPLAVLSSVLSAGDAPALFLVVLGACMATGAPVMAVVGGAVAVASLAVKPIALPALVLLAFSPWAVLGAAVGLGVWGLGFLAPLLDPKPDGGLLGTWWLSSGGAPPDGWLGWIGGGVAELATVELWALAPILVLAPLLCRGQRLLATLPLVAGLAVAAGFGSQLEPRYLGAAVVAALPFLGQALGARVAPAMLWPTLALLTQLSVHRAQQDPEAQVLRVAQVPFPVDTRALFDQCSTVGATALRAEAFRLAESLPEGAVIQVTPRLHGREGELVWPLRVLRPDVRVELGSSDGRPRPQPGGGAQRR
jgi:hypothetical protein